MAALVKNGRGGTADALKIAEHALAVKEAGLGRDDVDLARTVHNLGLVRLDRGEFNDALALHLRALEIRQRSRSDDGSVAGSLDLVALSLIRLKRFDEAGKHLADALRIREARATQAPLALAQTLEFVGLMHRCRADSPMPAPPSNGRWRAASDAPGIPTSRPASRSSEIFASSSAIRSAPRGSGAKPGPSSSAPSDRITSRSRCC